MLETESAKPHRTALQATLRFGGHGLHRLLALEVMRLHEKHIVVADDRTQLIWESSE